MAYAGSLAATMLSICVAGCGFTSAVGSAVRGDPMERLDSDALGNDPDKLRAANRELIAEMEQLRRDRDRLVQSNTALQDELTWAHEDFNLVERQFATFEEQLVNDSGKAAAVSAAAEARIRYGRILQDRSLSASDSTMTHALSLIATSERLVHETNYTAALFFAERAGHMMSAAERRARLGSLPTSLLVSVDHANLRNGPGQNFDVVERLDKDASLLCLDESAGWYRVTTPSGAEGWIHSSVVR
jgi:Bacterial SH3 domain